MKKDAGRVDRAAPSTYVTAGTVASRGEGARAYPTNEPTAAINTPFESSSIWQTASRATVRFGDLTRTLYRVRRSGPAFRARTATLADPREYSRRSAARSGYQRDR